MIIYILYVRPFKERYKNNLESFNEISILVISYHLLFYTDFIQDEDMKSSFGLS
jgi:hypothetical protein